MKLKRFATRTLAFALAVLFCAVLFSPISVLGAPSKTFRLTEGSIVIGAESDGLSVKVGEKRSTVSADTQIVIEGNNTATKNTITVRDNVKAQITLSGVRIESVGALKAPILLSGAETVVLTLSGANSLTAPKYMSALQVARYAKLTITGDGSLSARGGENAAGIGGGWNSGVSGAPCGNITILGSVRISAYGGDGGAAIGGGDGGDSGVITIGDSASVMALGGKNAAGIGSGNSGRSRNITITSNAVVEAAGGEHAAGIGCGNGGSASKISILGNANIRAAGSEDGAGIGCGKSSSGTLIDIGENATVRARGGKNAAGIGAGSDSSLSVGVTRSGFASVYAVGGEKGAGIGGTSLSCGNINFSDSATAEAYGGIGAAGVGSGEGGTIGEIKFSSRASVYAYGGLNGAGIGSGQSGSYKKITVSGFSALYALGGKYAAGIGGGKTSVCGQIHIRDNALVTAQGGNFGAGIGTGAKNAPDYAPLAGEIYIYNNASVRAAGGKDGAGIGGGLYSSGAKVIISDSAIVDAYNDFEVELDNKTVKKKADYTAVDAALAKVPKNLKEYTDDSVKILKAAIKEIVYDLPATDQARVDNYAAAVERAISILVKKTIDRKVSVSTQNYKSGEPIVVKWEGATSPKDRIVILKRSHLPTDTEIDPDLKVSYGTPLLSAECKKKGKLAKSGSVSLAVAEDDLLYSLGYNGLPAGKYTVYLCLEGEDAPVALANFAVHGTAYLGADYSEVEALTEQLPKDKTLYTDKSWKALQNALDAVKYGLSAKEQTKVDGYAKSIRDALAALVPKETENSQKDDGNGVAASSVAFIHPNARSTPYTVTDLARRSNSEASLLLLAESAGKPESFGWGLIPSESPNVETAPKGSIVSAINYVVEAKNVSVSKDETFDTKGIGSANIGAGAGCSMQGSLHVAETALFNGTVTSATVTLEYGASIGALAFDYIAGESFVLPSEVLCPGYIFKGWSTDEGGKSAASGDFTVSGDLTFYANWDVVPVSIEKNFQFSSAALGVEYSDHLKMQEASSNFTVTLSAGELPTGLSLDPETGVIHGKPTDLGTYNFTLLIVDANGTRTEQDYFITVYQPIELSFTFYTSKNDHASTTGDITFYYTYHDLGNGLLKESERFNLRDLLGAGALQPDGVDTFTLSASCNLGIPSQLFFENTADEDGWRVDKVVISTPGSEGVEAFERTYQINAWIGHIDDANFFESGAFVIFLVLLLILVIIIALLLFLRFRSHKKAQKEHGDKSGTPHKTAGTPASPSVRTSPTPIRRMPQATRKPNPPPTKKQ